MWITYLFILGIVAGCVYACYKSFNAPKVIAKTHYLTRANESIIKNRNGVFYVKDDDKKNMIKIEPYDMYIYWDQTYPGLVFLNFHSNRISMDIDPEPFTTIADFERIFADVKYDNLSVRLCGKYVVCSKWDKEKQEYITPKEYYDYIEECKKRAKEIEEMTNNIKARNKPQSEAPASDDPFKMTMVDDGQ